MKRNYTWSVIKNSKDMEKIARTDLFVHDMVHDNPGLKKYQSAYNDPKFLKARGYDGKTFDLYNCAQYALLWDGVGEKYGREAVFPVGSKERAWVEGHKAELQKLYKEAAAEGLTVSFMMDIIVFPRSVLRIFPEILNEEGKIDILRPMTQTLIEEMFAEMFREFPQIGGIYVRYGETYAQEKYGIPYHTGNNPVVGDAVEYHLALIGLLIQTVCEKHKREIYYRTWGFGDFQRDKEAYLRVSERVPVNERFYFCIKHTRGDFWRNVKFNPSLNEGKHQQIVEVQAAREYEGKGAFPNYIGNDVINGAEELKWLMKSEENQNLRDIINVKNSLVKGIWTWSRGGGWDGPYINGENGKNGEVVVKEGRELWCDLNAYVITQWAKDTSKSDRHYVLQYAKEVLEMSDKDSLIFYELCLLSSRAVLFGRGITTDKFAWCVLWTRDQNINATHFYTNVENAISAGAEEELLWEKQRSVEIWKDIVSLSEKIATGNAVHYIRVTSKYGYYLFSIFERMYRANIYARQGKEAETQKAIAEYDELWKEWIALRENNDCCPTLYAKEDENLDMLCYRGNFGFDSVINGLRR